MTIICNGVPALKKIIMKGDVWKPLKVEPPSLAVSSNLQTSVTREITIISDVPVRFGDPRSKASFIQLSMTEVEEQKVFKLNVTVTPSGTPFPSKVMLYVPVKTAPTEAFPWPTVLQIPLLFN